jgi:thiol-disulfide isomerase/thioredoxin
MEKGSIGNLQIIAGQRGGKCLSEVYQGIWQKLAFQCAEGHIWNASPANIKKGTWCPVCAHLRHQGRPLRYSIETLEALANQHGGKCLSTEYKGMGQKHKFQCAEGHVWDTVPSSIQRGTWCPVCGHLKISQQNRGRFRCSIETLEALANQRGGVCLSTEYRGPQEKLTFRCAKEHTWDAIPNSIQQGRWCPICKRRGPRDMEGDPLDKVKEIAANLDVECLSAEYKGMGQKLTFRCRKGHTWEASPVAIKR